MNLNIFKYFLFILAPKYGCKIQTYG